MLIQPPYSSTNCRSCLSTKQSKCHVLPAQMSLWGSCEIWQILCHKARRGCLCTLNANLLCEFLHINLQEMSWQRPAKEKNKFVLSMAKLSWRSFVYGSGYNKFFLFLISFKVWMHPCIWCIKQPISICKFCDAPENPFSLVCMHTILFFHNIFWFSIYIKPFIRLVWSIW